jgi:hypothetical protein
MFGRIQHVRFFETITNPPTILQQPPGILATKKYIHKARTQLISNNNSSSSIQPSHNKAPHLNLNLPTTTTTTTKEKADL